MSRLNVRFGEAGDDEQLRALLARNAMPGSIAIAFTTEPSYFDAVEVEGRDPRVILGEKDGRLVGSGLTTTRDVYINGKPSTVGYLSSLRIDRDARNSTGLSRGFRFLSELHQERGAVRIYLTTILEENAVARSVLTSGRGGLPVYNEIGGYNTLAIPLFPRRVCRLEKGFSIVSGRDLGAELITRCLNKWGRHRQFFPVYGVGDITGKTGLLRGLDIDHFRVAVKNGMPVGVMAVWDQLDFRQNVVTDYSPMMRFLKRCSDGLSRVLPVVALPSCGQPIKNVMAACIAVENDDQGVFRLMLNHTLHELAATDRSFLMLGFADRDALAAAAKRYLRISLRSRIYVAAWGDGQAEVEALDQTRIPYLELGSL